MKRKFWLAAAGAALLLALCLTACAPANEETTASSQTEPEAAGTVYLYGEEHANEKMIEQELEHWEELYAAGARDLFLEDGYASAQLLNQWMQAEDDTHLNEHFKAVQGTMGGSEVYRTFYKQIKQNCPETVFHGTDIEHMYRSLGYQYLTYLTAEGKKDSPEYAQALESIQQAKRYYSYSYAGKEAEADVYRENCMAENFMRELDALDAEKNTDVMGIYGAVHTALDGMNYEDGTVPCMANQLYQKYGERIVSKDLRISLKDLPEETTPVMGEKTLTIAGKTYTAIYLGEEDIAAWAGEAAGRRFWRVEDAYADFTAQPRDNDVLPYNSYPVPVQEGQAFALEYLFKDGTTEWMYYAADGTVWQDMQCTSKYAVEPSENS